MAQLFEVHPLQPQIRLLKQAAELLHKGCVLAVPTGIVSAEFTAQRLHREPTTRTCHECLSEGHQQNARFCRDCGAQLPPWHSDRVSDVQVPASASGKG